VKCVLEIFVYVARCAEVKTLQPVSAGFFLSGYGRAVTMHAVVALALQLGALIQVIIALGLGYTRRHWLHVPLGVGLVLALRNATQLVGTGPRLE